MTSKEALENIKTAVEYLTRLDYVNPIVRGEVKELLYNAYHKTTPEFEIIEKDLEVLEALKKYLVIDEDYYSQGDGSTKAIKICIPNCISVEEDDDYIDDCYPNYDYEIIEEWLENDTI